MPDSGTLAVLVACGDEGTCRGACRLDWVVSSAVTPPQPPLLRGPYDKEV